jgi:flagellar protein FliS
MTAPNLRDRYLQDSINTASPGRLLIMLYDRLVLDLMQGEESLRVGEREAAHERITHAQEIVLELRTSLDVEAWSGAPGLAGLYSFLLTELIGANIARDAGRVAACRTLVEPLRDAWREAAAAAVAG